MKKNLLLVTALIAMFTTVFAQPSALSLTVAGTDKDIAVDGYDDDAIWQGVDAVDYEYTLDVNGTLTQPDDAADLSATLKLAWDMDGLYAFVKINDDSENYWKDGEHTWEQDNCEFFFYFGEEGTWGADAESAVEGDSLSTQCRLQMESETYKTRIDGRYKGEWAAPPFGSADTGAIQAKAIKTDVGWNLEVIFPWDVWAMTYEPAEDLKFGFDATIGDADGDALKNVCISVLNDSETDAAYDNKKYLNTLVLGEIPEIGVNHNHTINAVYVYPTLVNNVLKLKGKVTSLSIYSITGQEVLNIKDVNSKIIDVSELQSGIYFVNLNNETSQKIIKH